MRALPRPGRRTCEVVALRPARGGREWVTLAGRPTAPASASDERLPPGCPHVREHQHDPARGRGPLRWTVAVVRFLGMTRVLYFTACTLDGFIADENDSLDRVLEAQHDEDDG